MKTHLWEGQKKQVQSSFFLPPSLKEECKGVGCRGKIRPIQKNTVASMQETTVK